MDSSRPEFDVDAASLLADPRLQSYFEDEDSPLVQEIRRLERMLTDASVTDHIKLLQAKFTLLGMNQVYRILEALAKKQAEVRPTKVAEPVRRFLRERPGVG